MEVGTIAAAEASTGSRTMADLALAAGEKFSDRPALRHKVGEAWVDITFADLADEVRRVAGGLIDVGIQPGDKVAILSNTRAEWTFACFGILAAGATCVSIYQTNSPQECHYVLQHSELARRVRRGRRAAREDPLDRGRPPEPRADHRHGARRRHRRFDLARPAREARRAARGRRRGRARGRRLARRQLPLHLHLRHHRPAEGVHAHARQLPARDQHGRDAEHDAPGRAGVPVPAAGARVRAADPVRVAWTWAARSPSGSATRRRSSPT